MTYKLIGIGVVVLLLIAAAGYVIHTQRQDAADDALEGVRQNNDKLGQAAEGAAIDYDDCRRADRLWDYERGRCGGAAKGGRN